MINDKIFFDEKDPTGINYDTPFVVFGSFNGRLWSKTPAGTVKFYVQDDAKGKVLQVVQAVHSTQVLISSTTYVDSGLSATITPTKATSKIYIIISHNWEHFQATNNDRTFYINLLRDATEIFQKIGTSYGAVGSTGFFQGALDGSISKLDTPTIPATPVSITYKTQSKVSSTANSTSSRFNFSDSESTITLIEIEG